MNNYKTYKISKNEFLVQYDDGLFDVYRGNILVTRFGESTIKGILNVVHMTKAIRPSIVRKIAEELKYED